MNDILTLNQCANVAGGNVGGPLALALAEPFLLWRIETTGRAAFRIEEIWKLLWTCGQINKAMTRRTSCEELPNEFFVKHGNITFQYFSEPLYFNVFHVHRHLSRQTWGDGHLASLYLMSAGYELCMYLFDARDYVY